MSADLPQTSNGKIARLPARLREEVCRRLHDGETAPQLLAWLNGTPEAQEVCRKLFDGEPISPQNLSAWRMGGFLKWQKEQKRLERSRERCRFSRQMVEASGGNMAEGVLASLTGDLAEILEEIDDLREAGAEIDPKLLSSAGKVLVSIRGKEIESRRLDLDERRADQQDRALNMQETKLRRDTAELFMQFYTDARAREIMESKADKTVKMDGLIELIFGAKPAEVQQS
jgi:hypothetical protein